MRKNEDLKLTSRHLHDNKKPENEIVLFIARYFYQVFNLIALYMNKVS